jgi:colanic acid/amylovoran biosynthesis glycosyltransferase
VAGLDLSDLAVEVVDRADGRDRVAEVVHRMGRETSAFVGRVQQYRPALVHAHFGPDAFHARALRRSLASPLVVTFHGYDATQRPTLRDDPSLWLYRRRLPRLFATMDLAVAVSDHIREALLASGAPPEKVRTHRIGVNLADFAPAPLADRETVVLAVGRFVEKKGFPDLIQAMGKVQRARPAARLVLIGDGPGATTLRQQAERSRIAVEFLGARPRDEVASWMRRARVLVVPSVTAATGDTEGLPTTLVEGMASGTPVVATRHAGIPEAVIDGVTGHLVAERDPAALGTAVLDLMSDDERWASFAAASRARAEADFDLRQQTSALEDLYDEVVAGHST